MLKQIAHQLKKPSGFLGVLMAILMIKRNRKAYEILGNEMKIKPSDCLLEIGYGPGWGMHFYAKQHESCSIHGIDFSNLMFQRASRRNKQFIAQRRIFLQFGDFIETTVTTNNFDIVYCLNVVYFWNDLQTPFQKVHSLLKDGGRFHIYMTGPEDLKKMKLAEDVFNKYTIVQMVEALKQAGYSDIEYFGEDEYFIRAIK